MPSSGKKKEWMLKNGMMMGALRHRLWMESGVWMRFARGGKITVNFDGLVRPASRLGYQIIRRRIQQIFLHFCKPTSGGVVNSLGLAQSVDWSIWFVQLYEQTIQGAYNFFIFSGRPQPRSKSWCFTMPSEKALTLPWNGLGGFLLSLLSAKLIMIKIPRGEEWGVQRNAA